MSVPMYSGYGGDLESRITSLEFRITELETSYSALRANKESWDTWFHWYDPMIHWLKNCFDRYWFRDLERSLVVDG